MTASPMKRTRFCADCGAENARIARYCRQCGRRFPRGASRGLWALGSLCALLLVAVLIPFPWRRSRPPRPTPAPGAHAGEVRINPVDGATMVWVPAGEFLMGSQFAGNSNARPQRTVFLDGYWIYKTEVTWAQYEKFCRLTGRQLPEAPDWGRQADHPVVNVSWHDAKAYAEWAGVALPTEAQWEKAARGTDGRIYPWGNYWEEGRCQWNASCTERVGSFTDGASPYGALDMAGNAWEWCADWYEENYYSHSPSVNPTGPAKGDSRVLRGGSWRRDAPRLFRAADRAGFGPGFRGGDVGFRCVVRSPGP